MIRRTLARVLNPVRAWLTAPVLASLEAKAVPSSTQQLQLLLALHYRRLRRLGEPLPRLDEVGFRVYSESDEDGILHYIFSLIGTSTKKLVDIGAAGIAGSNTANLLINGGWTGLLIDGDPARARDLERFYATCPDTRNYPPAVIHAHVTVENINALLSTQGYGGEIDLLCLDIDGMDYWILEALTAANPRVIVVEYQCIWGAGRSVSVPYAPQFAGRFEGQFGIYNSASLPAFVKLGRTKGYRLIGCQRYGYNAFLVRNDVGRDVLPEVTSEECANRPFARWAAAKFLNEIKDLAWVEV